MQENLYDKSGMRSVIRSMPEQIKQAYAVNTHISVKGMPKSIFVCGMGGSAIAGLILKSYLSAIGLKVPVFNIQDYDIPEFADHDSIMFISSYSGNTEETISCYRQALKKGINIITITSGGKLAEYAARDHLPLIQVPKNIQPRNAVAYLFFPMLNVLENSGIISNQSDKVKIVTSSLSHNLDSYENSARELAEKLYDRIIVIYSSNNFGCIAYRWKCEFNENTKIPAFYHQFPELNHNEMQSYENADKLGKQFHIIILKDESDHKRIHKRMELTKKLIKDKMLNVNFTELSIKGNDILTRMFGAIFMGDMVSYYLALKYATDPTPVDMVEKFKKDLGPYL